MDSCEKGKAIEQTLKDIVARLTNCIVITSWTPYHWDYFKDSIEEFLPTTREVHLEPLGKEDSLKILAVIFSIVSISDQKYLLKNDVAESVCELSGGVPANIVNVAIRSFQEAFRDAKTDVDKESTIFAAKSLGIYEIQSTIAKLNDYHLQILRLILLSRDERGTRPSALVDLLGKDKGTISYHLSELSRLHLLIKQEIGRWVFYRVPQTVEPYLGQRLVQESDFLA